MSIEFLTLAEVAGTLTAAQIEGADALLDTWMKFILGSAGALVAVIVGIKWLLADRNKIAATASEERGKRIQALEEIAKQCQEDRMGIHAEMNKLQEEVRGLYRAIIEGKFGDLNLRPQNAEHLIQT